MNTTTTININTYHLTTLGKKGMDMDNEDSEMQEGENRNGDTAAQDNEVINRYAQIFDEKDVSSILGTAQTSFEKMRAVQEATRIANNTSFADKKKWELAEWLITNVNQYVMDEFLKLSIVSKNETTRDISETC